jgi:hypothetical protein
MRVVMVEVGRKACEMELEDSLASMQRAVGGLIQAVYEPGGRDAALICNEEGKLLGLPLNRALRDENGEIYDAIAGTFFICGALADSENFTSLTDEQVAYWLGRFAKPEFFVNVNGQIICVPVEEPCQ